MIGANAPGVAYFGEAFDAPTTYPLALSGTVSPAGAAAVARRLALALAGALAPAGAASVGRARVIDTVHGGLIAAVSVSTGAAARVASTGRVTVG